MIGQALAEKIGASFVDGDDLHPSSNRAKMASGTPLTDEDRWPWLEQVGRTLESSGSIVVACSALKRAYRDRIRSASPRAEFLLLTVAPEELRKRMEERPGHFMPASLLQSQLDLLEPLAADEVGIVTENSGLLSDVVDFVIKELAQHGAI